MLPEFSSSAPSWSTHVMRHSQQAIESDSSYVLASLKCLYYVVHVFLILNIHNIHYHGVDLRWKHFLWISKLVTFEWFYNLIPFQTKTIFNHINHDKRGFSFFFCFFFYSTVIFLMHSSWLYHIQFTVSTYSIQTYKYINKQDGIHCTHSNGTMKTEKKKTPRRAAARLSWHISR